MPEAQTTLDPCTHLVSLAVDLIASVSERTFNSKREPGYRHTVPASMLHELADEIEKQYPGWIGRTRKIIEGRERDAR